MRELSAGYEIEGKEFLGFIAYKSEEEKPKWPTVLIAPTWRGVDAFAEDQARKLANLGYLAFVVDLYGEGHVAKNDAEAAQLMAPLFLDRALLQKRMRIALNNIRRQRICDSERIGVIGFCFGGLAAIELLRSGEKIRGVASFHATLAKTLGAKKAIEQPIAPDITASLLMLHGHEDPLVSASDLKAMQDEMTEAGVDWQLHSYSHTSHAFTNPKAKDTQNGLIYNKRSAKRSWLAMKNFFEELFV